MKISPTGVDLIKQFESLRLKAYQDIAGIWTIGYGSTKGVTPKLEINLEEAEFRLKSDINPAEQVINSIQTLLLQNEFDALVSLVFNIGVGAFKKSTIFKLLWAKELEKIPPQFLRWNKVRIKGELKVSPGLMNRRIKEKRVFEFGDYD